MTHHIPYSKAWLVLLMLLCFAFAKAQLESSQWYFGEGAGIDFRTGQAIATDRGVMRTGEGCATISDATGNLLFYTDGSTVYNGNHEIMENGEGLQGDSSSTSSAVAVPLPESDDLYYIFTVDTDDLVYRNAQGLQYSIVDMRLNDGDGAVLADSKNTPVLGRTSEKLTAVENNSGTGFWIITQFEDQFYSYELLATGLNPQPVVSQVPPFIELLDYFITNVDVAAMRGYIKVNNTGTKIAAAHFSNNNLSDFDGVRSVLEARSRAFAQGGELYLYDFDNSTGVVSNPIALMTKEDRGSFYGVEFSPDGKYLYAEIDYLEPAQFFIYEFLGGEIAQFDLTATDVASSKQTIYQDRNELFRGALQLGLDGNIYHARIDQNAISVLNNPNDDGVPPTYRFNAIPLTPGRTSVYGLPIFVQSFFETFSIEVNDACLSDPVNYVLEANTDNFEVEWTFGDPGLGTANESVNQTGSINYNRSGTYQITAVITTPFQQITQRRNVTIFPQVTIEDIALEQTICDRGAGLTFFDLSQIPGSISTTPDQLVTLYPTEQNATNQINAIDTSLPYPGNMPQQYIYVRVENANCNVILPYELTVERCPIQVFNVLTPNGDGSNESLAIDNLRLIYEQFQLQIFNRYGRLVWEGNQESEDWDGTANVAGTNGDLLPAGTYFYTLVVDDPSVEKLTGYIYLTY